MKIVYESIFEAAEDYEKARIPGIVCCDSGDIFAYCELRRSDSDWAVTDIGMKRSSDGGRTWSERNILVSGGSTNTINNPVMITDGNTLHFLYCVNYHSVFYKKSTDLGASWSEEKDITASIRDQAGDFFFSCIATGPTHGIKLSSGRLMVPVWMAYNKDDEKSHHPSVISLIYSDDGGDSWKLGEINGKLSDPSEFCVAQNKKGEIIANIRHEGKERCRAFTKITDGGEFSEITFYNELPDPVCCAGMCSADEDIMFSNCADKNRRVNLTLRKLSSDGRIKDSLALAQNSGYSDVAVSPDKQYAYILYERGNTLLCCIVNIS